MIALGSSVRFYHLFKKLGLAGHSLTGPVVGGCHSFGILDDLAGSSLRVILFVCGASCRIHPYSTSPES